MPKPKEIIKTCKHHGETLFTLEKQGKYTRYRCKKCRSRNVTQYRRNIKKRLIELHGGKCTQCGYDKCQEALEFHHLDPSQKDFGLGKKGLCHTWPKAKAEAEKCILVCSNCHREIHAGLIQV
jgi:predicted HNH restriction endonuclease